MSSNNTVCSNSTGLVYTVTERYDQGLLLLSHHVMLYFVDGIINCYSMANTPMIILYFTGLDNKKILRKNMNIVLPISFNICFGCSKEPSH